MHKKFLTFVTLLILLLPTSPATSVEPDQEDFDLLIRHSFLAESNYQLLVMGNGTITTDVQGLKVMVIDLDTMETKSFIADFQGGYSDININAFSMDYVQIGPNSTVVGEVPPNSIYDFEGNVYDAPEDPFTAENPISLHIKMVGDKYVMSRLTVNTTLQFASYDPSSGQFSDLYDMTLEEDLTGFEEWDQSTTVVGMNAYDDTVKFYEQHILTTENYTTHVYNFAVYNVTDPSMSYNSQYENTYVCDSTVYDTCSWNVNSRSEVVTALQYNANDLNRLNVFHAGKSAVELVIDDSQDVAGIYVGDATEDQVMVFAIARNLGETFIASQNFTSFLLDYSGLITQGYEDFVEVPYPETDGVFQAWKMLFETEGLRVTDLLTHGTVSQKVYPLFEDFFNMPEETTPTSTTPSTTESTTSTSSSSTTTSSMDSSTSSTTEEETSDTGSVTSSTDDLAFNMVLPLLAFAGLLVVSRRRR